MDYVSYFRPGIDAMEGYAPGEQPKTADIIKLNTNESPFPPSPGVKSFFIRNRSGSARSRLVPQSSIPLWLPRSNAARKSRNYRL